MSGKGERDRAMRLSADRSIVPPLGWKRQRGGVSGISGKRRQLMPLEQQGGAVRRYFAEPGQRFGRLTVIREVRKHYPSARPVWAADCACDCGNAVTVRLIDLYREGSRRTQSCGCYRDDMSRARRRAGLNGRRRKRDQFVLAAGR
jgi:hypothetical protein